MYHYLNDARNIHGEVLAGFFVRAVNTATNAGASLYADENLTPIVSVSGIADAALVSDDGNIDFYVGVGTYHLDFYASDGATFVKRVRNVPMTQNIFDTAGVMAVTASGFGYSLGNGGTATQATSKTTSVNINKPAGVITLNNAALAAGASASFTVFNSVVTVNDTIIVNLHTGSYATAGTYQVTAESVSAGAFLMTVKNISGGLLGEALILNFCVIKGQAA